MLYPCWLGVDLRELLIGGGDGTPLMVENDRAGTGRALVESEHKLSLMVGHAINLLWLRGARAPDRAPHTSRARPLHTPGPIRSARSARSGSHAPAQRWGQHGRVPHAR